METKAAETTERICPSCHKPGSGIFCTHCSEIMDPQRISIKRVVNSVPDVFFDVEHGLFYSIKMLIKAPGETIRRFFNGERQRHYKPLKFVLFLGGLYAFLFISFDIHADDMGVYEKAYINTTTGRATGKEIDLFTAQWTSVLMLIQFPLIALATWLVFRKRKYYYGEHFVANAYFIGEVVIFQIVLFPVYYLVNGTSGVNTVNLFYTLWIWFYYTYAFYDFFYFRKTTRGLVICIILVFCLILFISVFTLILSPLLYFIKQAIWG